MKKPSNSIFFDEEDDDDLGFYGWSPMDQIATAKVTPERVRGTPRGAPLIIHINQKMKEHTDNLMRGVLALTPRLTQLETETLQVENAVQDLKVCIEFNQGRTDKRLWELLGIAKQVQGSVKDMRDKQEIAGTQLQLELAKLTVTKSGKQPDKRNCPSQTSSGKNESPYELQDCQLPLPSFVYQSPPTPIPSNFLPDQPHQSFSPTPATMAPQLLSQSALHVVPSTSQPELFYQLPRSNSESMHQHYNQISTQEPQILHPALHQPNVPQTPQQHQMNSSLPCMVTESTYKSSHSPSRTPLSQHFYTGSTHILNQENKPYLEFPPGYSHLSLNSEANNLYSHNASSSYDCSTAKASQLHTSSNPSIGSGYSVLPTAKVLPRAFPTAVAIDTETDSGVSGERAAVDDVVDKIVAMGFRRDIVRATLKRLTDNRQSVDLNVLLDTVMRSQSLE